MQPDGLRLGREQRFKPPMAPISAWPWDASLQEPSAFKYRRHRLFDSREPRRRLLGCAKVVEVTPLPPGRQRLEGAHETWILSEPLRQLLGNRKIRGLLLLHPQPSLLDCDGLAHVGLDGRRLGQDLLHAGELHHPPGLHLTELHQYFLGILQQGALKETQPEVLFEAL